MSTDSRRRVLDVGQCQPDHASIRTVIESGFNAGVDEACDIQSALELLSEYEYDLVLVNRVLDATAEDGIELIRRMKSSPYLKSVPVMLVSNFENAQKEATAEGAEPGFGKASVNEPATQELLSRYLK